MGKSYVVLKQEKEGKTMELRKYQKEDSAIICSWIRDEKSLYQWSAERIGKFPLAVNALNDDYALRIKSGRFVPLSALAVFVTIPIHG